jgi:hypothetical protein
MLSQQSVFFFFLSSSSYPFNLSMAFTPWMISSSLKEEDEGEGEGEGEDEGGDKMTDMNDGLVA